MAHNEPTTIGDLQRQLEQHPEATPGLAAQMLALLGEPGERLDSPEMQARIEDFRTLAAERETAREERLAAERLARREARRLAPAYVPNVALLDRQGREHPVTREQFDYLTSLIEVSRANS